MADKTTARRVCVTGATGKAGDAAVSGRPRRSRRDQISR